MNKNNQQILQTQLELVLKQKLDTNLIKVIKELELK